MVRGMRRGRIISLIVAVGVFLIIQIPIMNLGLSYADEGFLVLNANQIRQGMVPYRDFFLTTTPGTYYLQAGVNAIFGESLLIERWIHVVLGVGLLGVAYWVYRKEEWPVGWYLVALGLSWVWAGGFGFYNLEVVITVMIMVGALRRVGWKWAMIAGVAAGLAVVFKQSVGGVMLVLGWLFAKEGRKQYLFGAGGILLIMFGYFVSQGAGKDFIDYTLFFAGEVKGSQFSFIWHRLMLLPIIILAIIIFRQGSGKLKLAIVLISLTLIGIYLLVSPEKWIRKTYWAYSGAFLLPAVVIGWKIREKDNWSMMEAGMGLSLFLSAAASSYDFGIVAMSGVLLYPIGFRIVKNIRLGYLVGILLVFAWLAKTSISTVSVYNSYPINNLVYNLNLRVGNGIKVTKAEGKELEKLVAIIHANTQPNDPILCFPHCPLINVLSDRPSPSYFSFFYPETFRLSDQEKTIADLERTSPKIVIIQKEGYADPFAQSRIDRLPKLMEYFESNYDPIYELENYKVYGLADSYLSTIFLAS